MQKYTENLFIRADATTAMGTGHVMRCIALAQSWQDHGGKVTFLTHCESASIQQRIRQEGFDFIPIETPHPDPNDLTKTLSILSNSTSPTNASLLVLDGYHFTPEYQKAIRDAGIRLLVIDDMNHLSDYHADIILNQNIHAPTLKYSSDESTVLLLGCKYVLLRREFIKYRNWKREIPEIAKKILVTMGGSDPNNVTLKVVRALNRLNHLDLEVKIVAGTANLNISSLEKELHLSPFNCELLCDVNNMPELMAWADIAISSAGSTCWELAFAGTSSLVITIADNQKEVGEGLEKMGMIKYLGYYKNLSSAEFKKELELFIKNHNERRNVAQRLQGLVDGRSMERIIEIIDFIKSKSYFIEPKIRQADYDDVEHIWRIANDPRVRSNSFNSDPIPWNEHVHWFNEKLKSPFNVYWVLDIGGIIGAQVRFEKIRSETAEVHFSVLPPFRGKNIASRMINHTFSESCKRLSTSKIKGILFVENARALKVFEKSSFTKTKKEIVKGKNCYVFERVLNAK